MPSELPGTPIRALAYEFDVMRMCSSVHEVFQARILEWVAISSLRGLPDPGIKLVLPADPALAGGSFPTGPPEKT